MSKAFNRYIKVTISSSVTGQKLTFSQLNIKFDITKSISQIPDTCRLVIYNISDNTRGVISKSFDKLSIECGYAENYGLIFTGDIFNIFHRKTPPDFVTEIYASDSVASITQSITNVSFGPYVSELDIIDRIRRDMKLSIGEIDLRRVRFKPSGWNFCGRSSDALNELSSSSGEMGFDWYVSGGALYVLNKNTVLKSKQVYEIDALSGMVGSPTITEIGAEVKTLLNWQITPNEEILIKSSGQVVKLSNLKFLDATKWISNGRYRVLSIRHYGESRGNSWYTYLETARDYTNA